jgi:hypothetical protein
MYVRTRVSVVCFFAREDDLERFSPRRISYGKLATYFPDVLKRDYTEILFTMDSFCTKGVEGT